MTNISCKKFDGVRKVRLKTASGVRTLCYNSSQSPTSCQGNNDSPPARSSMEKVSQEGSSQASVVSKEQSFGSLPELFDFQDQFSLCERARFEGCESLPVDLPPDFSTYDFWASESSISLSNAVVALSDTFPLSDHPDMILNHSLPVLESVVEESKVPDPDLNSMRSSCIDEEITNRRRYWDLPILELEEDIFESAIDWDLLKEFTDGERDVEGEKSIVDKYLVDGSPPQFSNAESNVQNLDSDSVLVFAPNRYLDEFNASCIFQSSPAKNIEVEKSEVENSGTIDVDRIQDSQKSSSRSLKIGSRFREDCLKEVSQSIDRTKCRNSHTASCLQSECSEEVQDQVIIAKSAPSKTALGEKVRKTLPMQDVLCVNHRRRRFSAPGMKRSKFLKPAGTLTSLDLDSKPSPHPASRASIQRAAAGRRSSRGRSTPIRKAETVVRRLLKQQYRSDSPPAGGGGDHSDRNFNHESPRGTKPPERQHSVPSDDEKVERRPRRADISLRESYASSSLKGTSNPAPNPNPSGRGRPRTTTLNLSANACLLRKRRSRYTSDVCHDCPDADTTKLETPLVIVSSENYSHARSPQNNGKLFTASTTPRGSPQIAQLRRSPWDSNRKKVRTFRRRAPQSSPTTAAKKLHFYDKFIHGGGGGGSGQVVQQAGTPSSPDEPDFSPAGTKRAEKRVRRRNRPLPQSSIEILQGWIHENLADPYPTRKEKEDLFLQTGLKMSQIDNWLGNARQKLKLKSRPVKDFSESSSSPELPKKRPKRKRSYPLKIQI